LIAEELSDRPDEGVLRTLERLGRFLATRSDLRIYHCRGSAPDDLPTEKLPFTRLGITRALWSALRNGRFDVVVYVPSASLTVNALWRARLIRTASRCPVVSLGFQRRKLDGLSRRLAGVVSPGMVLVTSKESADEFAGTGLRVMTVPMGVELDRFCPAEPRLRRQLRASMGWAEGEEVVLHVGHLRARRGLSALADLAGKAGLRVVIVTSVSERGEEDLASTLRERGVELHHEFIPDIERFYQAADAYVFPVRATCSAIDFPLSILEALASGLPVLTTKYGALPEHFDGTGGLRFLGEGESLEAGIAELLGQRANPRLLVQNRGWDETFDSWLQAIGEALA
jgi:glycosyltransferase involved in cell wall biosynthesis